MTNDQIIAQLKNMKVETDEERNARYDADNKASAERFARHCTVKVLETGHFDIMAAQRRVAEQPGNPVWAADLDRVTAKFQKALQEATTRFEGMNQSAKYAAAVAKAAELGIEF